MTFNQIKGKTLCSKKMHVAHCAVKIIHVKVGLWLFKEEQLCNVWIRLHRDVKSGVSMKRI